MSIELASQYEGETVDGRYHGRGTYKYLDFKYEGNFLDGQFHGEGCLYVNGGVYKGLWRHGQLVDGGFTFDDGLQYLRVGHKFWDYLSDQDRRFYQEMRDNLPSKGPYRDATSHKYVEELPSGCYDTIDGYYDPKKHMILSYEKNEEIRAPGPEEIDFILNYCRIGMDVENEAV